MPKSPLARKFGIKPLKPISPKSLRESMRVMTLAGMPPAEIAKSIRKRYRAGEWDDETVGFEHLEKFSVADWETLAKGVRVEFTQSDLNFAQGLEPPTRGRKSKIEKAKMLEDVAESARRGKAEAELEEFGDDAKKRLERLRRAIMSRLTIDEQADLLVSQARSDHGQTSRSATAHIIDILGMKAANVAEAPGSAPIFALPEGVGPSIR